MAQYNSIPSDKELAAIANQLFEGLYHFNNSSNNANHSDSGVYQRQSPADFEHVSSHSKEFNISDPQTSLKDPLLRDEGRHPLAQAGDGSSPHFKQEVKPTFDNYVNKGSSYSGLEDISDRFSDSYAYQSILESQTSNLDDLIPKDIFAFNNPVSYQPDLSADIPFAKETYSAFNAAISPLGSPYSFV